MIGIVPDVSVIHIAAMELRGRFRIPRTLRRSFYVIVVRGLLPRTRRFQGCAIHRSAFHLLKIYFYGVALIDVIMCADVS